MKRQKNSTDSSQIAMQRPAILILLSALICLQGCQGRAATASVTDPLDILKRQQNAILVDTPRNLGDSAFFCITVSNMSSTKSVTRNPSQADLRVSPASTFKIPLALMGFDSDILMDESHPVWKYRAEYGGLLDAWKKPQTPATWMKYSVVWFSQELTVRLGFAAFEKYVSAFNYGNMDLHGDPTRGEYLIKGARFVGFAGLLNSWLSSSLRISPREQVAFLGKLVKGTLPVSAQSMAMTRNILGRGKLADRYDLFGKTGTAQFALDDGQQARILWFVGWLEKGDERWLFAANRFTVVKPDTPLSPFADQVAGYISTNLAVLGIE